MNVLILEGGTTTSRATVVVDGRVAGQGQRPGGAADRDPERFREALRAAAIDALSGSDRIPDRVVACGMLGSEWGLAHVPHVPAPAGPRELAAGAVVVDLPDIVAVPVLIVPGVRTGDDICRGEETAALGIDASRVVFPGSHTKLVESDGEGRIVRLVTTAAGEIVRALAECTLAAADAAPVTPRALDRMSLSKGAEDSARNGLGHSAFQIRARQVLGEPVGDALAYLIGAVAVDDLRAFGEGPFTVAVDSRVSEAWATAYRVAASEEVVEIVDASEAVVRGALKILGAR